MATTFFRATDADPDAELTPQSNAIYYTPTNAFNYRQPEVPTHVFDAELRQMLAQRGSSGLIALDLSREMGLSYPATTPAMLARYMTIAGGDRLVTEFEGVAEIYYVIDGSGTSRSGDDSIDWSAGDVFVFPCNGSTTHIAEDEGAVLFVLTDEPLLSYCGGLSPSDARAVFRAAYYPADLTEGRMNAVYGRGADKDEAGKAVFFTSHQMQQLRTTSPFLTATLNSLLPGGDQTAHRHNAAAITLSIVGDGVHSLVEGERIDWKPWSVLVTPPTLVHSHHNRGEQNMLCFIVQDSGLHYYARTTGFVFERNANN